MKDSRVSLRTRARNTAHGWNSCLRKMKELSGLSMNSCMEHSSWVELLPVEDEGTLRSLYELVHRTQLMGGTPT